MNNSHSFVVKAIQFAHENGMEVYQAFTTPADGDCLLHAVIESFNHRKEFGKTLNLGVNAYRWIFADTAEIITQSDQVLSQFSEDQRSQTWQLMQKPGTWNLAGEYGTFRDIFPNVIAHCLCVDLLIIDCKCEETIEFVVIPCDRWGSSRNICTQLFWHTMAIIMKH